MDRKEVERIRKTPGVTTIEGGVSGYGEVALMGWHVDNKTGEVTPLGRMSYWHPNVLKRLRYKFLRKMGLV